MLASRALTQAVSQDVRVHLADDVVDRCLDRGEHVTAGRSAVERRCGAAPFAVGFRDPAPRAGEQRGRRDRPVERLRERAIAVADVAGMRRRER